MMGPSHETYRRGDDQATTTTAPDAAKVVQSAQAAFHGTWPGAVPPLQPAQRAAWAAGMQRAVGNQATAGMLLPLQAKLTIGEPDDPLEEEADRVADQVMRMPDPTLGGDGGVRQRKCSKCEAEEEGKVQRKGVVGAVQTVNAPAIVHEVLLSPGEPLDAATRAFMEPRFGRDFGRVRVHTDALASRSAEAVAARAYTVGADIAFRQGEYAPSTMEGQNLIAHELAHVVQGTPKLQRQASNTQQHGPNAQPQQRGASKNANFTGTHDVAFVCDADDAMTVEAKSLVSDPEKDVHRVDNADKLAAGLKSLTGPFGTIYIISHSSDDGRIYFDIDGPQQMTSISLGDLAVNVRGASKLGPASITFRGCRIGQNDPGLAALRDALHVSEVSGQTCFVVTAEFGPVSVGGQDIKSIKDLTPDVKRDFDEIFKRELNRFNTPKGRNLADGIVPLKANETAATHIKQLEAVYFRNGGKLVSVWSNKIDEEEFFPGDSVFIKDLEAGANVQGCRLNRVKAPNQAATPQK